MNANLSTETQIGGSLHPVVRCRSHYTDLGNLSAVEPWAQVWLWCDKCEAQWIGCMDAAECPK